VAKGLFRDMVIALIAAVSLVIPAHAQQGSIQLSARIEAGTCQAPGEAAATLTELTIASGDRRGQGTAVQVATSYSVVPLPLETLLASAFTVNVLSSASDESIACGEIGGALDENGALSIGLRPSGSSGLSGVAYMAPVAGDPSQTGISAFVADTGGVPAADVSTGQDPATPAAAGSEPVAGTYPATIRSQVTLVVGSLQRVDALFGEPRPNDTAWVDQVTAELTLWQILYSEAQRSVPPPEYAAFHDRYVDALSLLDSAARDVVDALDTGDQESLAQAGEKIQQGIEALRALDAPDQEGTPAARQSVLIQV
jgi:hypothetical protein